MVAAHSIVCSIHPGTVMSPRTAQINTPGAINAPSSSDLSDFPVYPCEEPNSKEGGDFWIEMNIRLDKHSSSFVATWSAAPPPRPVALWPSDVVGSTVTSRVVGLSLPTLMPAFGGSILVS